MTNTTRKIGARSTVLKLNEMKSRKQKLKHYHVILKNCITNRTNAAYISFHVTFLSLNIIQNILVDGLYASSI